MTPPPIPRPNGKLYRPRKITIKLWEDEDSSAAVSTAGVLVLGTHDLDHATALATEEIHHWYDPDLTATRPQIGWWTLTYTGNPGRLVWDQDPEHGRAGIMFTADHPDEPHLAVMAPHEVATECDCMAGQDHVGPWEGPDYDQPQRDLTEPSAGVENLTEPDRSPEAWVRRFKALPLVEQVVAARAVLENARRRWECDADAHRRWVREGREAGWLPPRPDVTKGDGEGSETPR